MDGFETFGIKAFLQLIETLLGEKKYGDVLQHLQNPDNFPFIEMEGMDLITKISENGLRFATNSEEMQLCSEALLCVVRNYKPKEALIVLLEQGEALSNSPKFLYLLSPLQHVMLNLPKKREKTLSWVLSILRSHIKSCYVFDKKLKSVEMNPLVVEQDSIVRSFISTLKEYLKFYTAFVEELKAKENLDNVSQSPNSGNDSEISSKSHQAHLLRDYLVDLLGTPLIHLQVNFDKTSTRSHKTDARIVCEQCMELIHAVNLPPDYFFEWILDRVSDSSESALVRAKTSAENDQEDTDDEEEEIVLTMSSVINYYYLVFCEGVSTPKFSKVYSPIYFFRSILFAVTTVIKEPENETTIMKAISLAKYFLKQCSTNSSTEHPISYYHRLSGDALQTEIHRLFIDRLGYLCVYSESRIVRQTAYDLCKQYMLVYDPAGRYEFISYIIRNVPSDPLVGQIIMELKQLVYITLNENHPLHESEMTNYFLGESLARLVLKVCKLEHGPTTDICQMSNKIIASLNLVRFLVLRDLRDNKTLIKSYFPEIQKVLVEPLRKGLDLSRAHYELRLKEINDPHMKDQLKKDETRALEQVNCDVIIGDKDVKVGDIPLDQQKASIANALNTFDHITGLLVWLNEAFEDANQQLTST